MGTTQPVEGPEGHEITVELTAEELSALHQGSVRADVLRDVVARLEQALGENERSALEIRLEGTCRTCEAAVEPRTRRHVDGDGCVHQHVPDTGIDLVMVCPHCASGYVLEVNVGEIWDEVVDARFDDGVLTLTVDQLSEMDRNGDGWVCGSCLVRLRLPTGYDVGFEYV